MIKSQKVITNSLKIFNSHIKNELNNTIISKYSYSQKMTKEFKETNKNRVNVNNKWELYNDIIQYDGTLNYTDINIAKSKLEQLGIWNGVASLEEYSTAILSLTNHPKYVRWTISCCMNLG